MNTYQRIKRSNQLLDEICELADKQNQPTDRKSFPYQLGYLMGLWSSMMTDEQVAELKHWLRKLKEETAQKEAA